MLQIDILRKYSVIYSKNIIFSFILIIYFTYGKWHTTIFKSQEITERKTVNTKIKPGLLQKYETMVFNITKELTFFAYHNCIFLHMRDYCYILIYYCVIVQNLGNKVSKYF